MSAAELHGRGDAPCSTTPSAARTVARPAAPPLPSESLLQGRQAVEISHNGSIYRLQATKLGKLILTK